MMQPLEPPYDYEEGVRRISQRLALMRKSDWSPTPEVQRLRLLIHDLEALSDRLGDGGWTFLEAAHDADSIRGFGRDGSLSEAGLSNQGSFAGLRLRLRELAQTAKEQIEELPSARERHEVPYAAQLFLHLRYQCGMPPPTLYDGGQVLVEFSQLCEAANVFLSNVRIRNILSEALKTFDRHLFPVGLDYFLVPKE